MFLLHKIKSFNLKNIRFVFEELKKKRFLITVFLWWNKKGFWTIEKPNLFFICFKRMKKIILFYFIKKRVFTHNMNLCNHELKKNTNNTWSLSLFQKFTCIKKKKKSYLYLKKDINQFWFKKTLDLHLIKMQISFCLMKNSYLHLMRYRSLFVWRKTQICIKERCRFVLFEEKFRSTSKKDADSFYLKKNSWLHADL